MPTARGWGVVMGVLLGLVSASGAQGNGPDDPEGWSRSEIAGVYSLALPPELSPVDEKGADSIYHRFVSERLTVSIDYGGFSNSLTHVSGEAIARTSTRVDGREAVQVLWEQREGAGPLPYRAGVHVPKVGPPGVRLTLTADAASPAERLRALQIAHSIRFLTDQR